MSGAEPLRVLIPAVDARAGGVFVAQDEGIFSRYDLAVTTVIPDSQLSCLDALINGAGEAALINDSILRSWAAGADVILLSITHGPGTRTLVSRSDGTGVTSLAAVAAIAPNKRPIWSGGVPIAVSLALSNENLDVQLFTQGMVGTFADFLNGTLAVWPVTWRERAYLQSLGVQVRTLFAPDQGFGVGLAVRGDVWRAQPQACKSLVNGLTVGWHEARTRPHVLVEALVRRDATMNTGILLDEVEASFAHLDPTPVPTRDELQAWADRLRAVGIAAAVPAQVLIDDVSQESTSNSTWTLAGVVAVLLMLVAWQTRTVRRSAGDIKAGATQRHMLSDLPDLDGWEIGLHYRPHGEVSGDFYLCSHLADGRALIVVGDVSGHGVNAALVVSAAHKAGELLAPNHATLLGWVKALNNAIAPDLPRGLFITFVAVALDPSSGSAECVRAGHPPAYVFDADGTNTWTEMGAIGPALGLGSADHFAQTVTTQSLRLKPGSDVLLFTDGLTELFDRDGREYGVDGLLASVARHQNTDAQALVDALAEDAMTYGRRAEDDMTVLIIRRVRATVMPGALA